MVVDVGCWFLIIPTDSRETDILNRCLLSFLSCDIQDPLVIFPPSDSIYLYTDLKPKVKLYSVCFSLLSGVVGCSDVLYLAPLGHNVT
jgi:hypothetical protein